jgi:hypothetical protein
MKKHWKIAMIILGMITISSGCKKDNNNNGSSNNSSSTSINDKTWWGMFTYAGDTTQYYSVHFNPDSSLTWNQYLGEYKGTWSISSNHLTMDFGPNSIKITADVTNDNKLTNIKTNNTSIINSGQLLANPTHESLDGTIWKGVYSDKIGSTYNFEIDFKANSKVDIGFDGMGAVTYSYARSASGISIRTFDGDNSEWFGIIMSDTKMEGSERPENKWQVTKQ